MTSLDVTLAGLERAILVSLNIYSDKVALSRVLKQKQKLFIQYHVHTQFDNKKT